MEAKTGATAQREGVQAHRHSLHQVISIVGRGWVFLFFMSWLVHIYPIHFFHEEDNRCETTEVFFCNVLRSLRHANIMCPKIKYNVTSRTRLQELFSSRTKRMSVDNEQKSKRWRPGFTTLLIIILRPVYTTTPGRLPAMLLAFLLEQLTSFHVVHYPAQQVYLHADHIACCWKPQLRYPRNLDHPS